jgi:hypothetical protein
MDVVGPTLPNSFYEAMLAIFERALALTYSLKKASLETTWDWHHPWQVHFDSRSMARPFDQNANLQEKEAVLLIYFPGLRWKSGQVMLHQAMGGVSSGPAICKGLDKLAGQTEEFDAKKQ